MSEVNRDNKEFKFINEQVLPKRRKKFRKWLIPFLMTIVMALIFGLVAALTFCLAEPNFYRLLHKEEDNSFVIPTPISPGSINENENDPENNLDDIPKNVNEDSPLPTTSPDNKIPNGQVVEDSSGQNDKPLGPSPIIIESIDADIEDYLTMYADISKLTEQTGKSILTVSGIIEGKDWFGNPIEKRIYTTGIVIENNGTNIMLLVSYDRIKDATSIKIEFNETTNIDVTLHDYESELNLAVLSVNLEDIPKRIINNLAVVPMGESYTLAVGNPIIAMGSPNGYPQSIDMGIVTSKGSVLSITDHELDFYNTNILFNKDSDGIIVDYKGEVVGIITRTLKKGLNEGLSTVIGISRIKSYIDRMVSQTQRIYCGVIAESLPQEVMAEYEVTRGVYVYEVQKDSPAFNAGLMSGDIILNVGDRIISDMNNFYSTISEYEPGAQVTFKIKRTSEISDAEMKITVVLEDKK